MAVVVDASITLAWAFVDEQSPVADAALARVAADGGVVPAVWPFEGRNALLVGERRGRHDPSATSRFLQQLERMPIIIDRSPLDATILALARQYRLTVYDAAYLELAIRLGAILATSDRELIAAARRAGVALLQPA